MEDTQLVTRTTMAQAASTLADAFSDDPVWRWLVPSDKAWRRGAPGVFRADLANRLPHGAVYATGGLESIAAWSPPETWEPTLRSLARETPAALRLFGTGLPRALRFLSRMEAAHPKEPHFYLAILGTAPSRQGMGFGHTALLPVLEQCDEQGLPAYLESSKEQNLACYARHGVVASEPLQVLADAPPVWPMWREPASA